MNRSIRWVGVARAYAAGLLPTLFLILLVLTLILVACTNQPGASGAPGAGAATPGASGPGY